MRFKGLADQFSAAIFGALPLLVLLAPAQAQAPGLAMLDQLERGQWEVRFRETGAKRDICVRSGREFIQLKHAGNKQCSHYVVEGGQQQVTVQYTCAGNGYGRTNIRRETRDIVQISSTGMVNSRPFEFAAEARRTGTCN